MVVHLVFCRFRTSDYIIESLKNPVDLLSSEQYQSLLLFLTKNDHNLARLYQMLGSRG